MAVGADAMVIQSQSLQSDITSFDALLSSGSKQAKSSNPNILILGGLSTNARGASITSFSLFLAYENGKQFVNGYWFNVPGESQYCPTCTSADTQLELSFFGLLS